MALDLDSFDAALKTHYTNDRVVDMTYDQHPLLAMLPKMSDFTGRDLVIPVLRGNPQNRSIEFSVAQAGVSTSEVDAFTIKRVHDYSLAVIDNEAMLASKGNPGAFLDATTTEIDGAINSLSRSLATKLYKDGFGWVGRVAGAVTGDTLTLESADSVTAFEVGQVIQFAALPGSGALKDGGDKLTVVGVDRSLGKLKVSPNLENIAGIAVGDYIFFEGDRDNLSSPRRKAIAGLDAWMPYGGPSASLFFGVDRTVDTRLSGLWMDGTNMPVEEALIKAASLVSREGGNVDYAFMSFSQFAQLEIALGASVMRTNLKVGEIGFSSLRVNGPKGEIKVVADQDCPEDDCFMLTMKTWKLYSLGGKPIRNIGETDGNGRMLRKSNADAVEVRYGYYAQLGCSAPGHNIRIKLAKPVGF